MRWDDNKTGQSFHQKNKKKLDRVEAPIYIILNQEKSMHVSFPWALASESLENNLCHVEQQTGNHGSTNIAVW